MPRRRSLWTPPADTFEVHHGHGVTIRYSGESARLARHDYEHSLNPYRKFVRRCRMLQPGCQKRYLRWRKDKAPVCANPRCRRKYYTLRKLVKDGRMTEAEYRFELDALQFDFDDPVPPEQRAKEYRSLMARVGPCEVKAPGCRGIAVGWRKGRLPSADGHGKAPMACGNEACLRKAAALAARRRKRG